jgi:hypothetical protein
MNSNKELSIPARKRGRKSNQEIKLLLSPSVKQEKLEKASPDANEEDSFRVASIDVPEDLWYKISMKDFGKIFGVIKNLVSSKTLWGGVILVLQLFGVQADATVPDEAASIFDQLMTAVGAALVLIGRITAKPILPAGK